ncbi:MAG: tol-pal system YbgF family protein [Planctomycetota bacterium]
MSEQADKQGPQPGEPAKATPDTAGKAATTATSATAASTAAAGGDVLSKLMREGANADLDQRALAAAEAALAEGQRAIDQARAQLRESATETAPRARSGREVLLRVLLGVNLLAMVVVVMLPPAKATPEHTTPAVIDTAPPAHEPAVRTPRLDDPVIRAFAAADAHDYQQAIRLLDEHLAATPRLDPARKANVLLALEHYSAQLGDFARAQEYQRKAEALRNSHSLPDDLVQMALEAEKNGDVESMRRHYARLLLQQRQIPSALYRHVAEAYLKLGDSYRQEAEQAEQQARDEALKDLRERLRKQAAEGSGR